VGGERSTGEGVREEREGGTRVKMGKNGKLISNLGV